ncbi:MAG: transglycosylase SLT domain-containing protein [Candidatus Saccharibacteria bacterium]
MENPRQREPEPDDKMRQRVRNVGIASIGALATLGAASVGQAAVAERQHQSTGSALVAAEDLHVSRTELAQTDAVESSNLLEQKEVALEGNEPAVWWPTEVKQHWQDIQAVASQYLLDPYLVATIIAEESMGQNVNNPSGAQGLMQIMPSTAQEIARLRHRAYYNMQDPAQNLDYGCWLIHYLDEKYVKARGIDLNSEMGIAMLAVYYGDGEGAGEVWVRNGYNENNLSDQAKHIIPLWSEMYRDRYNSQSKTFSRLRGK